MAKKLAVVSGLNCRTCGACCTTPVDDGVVADLDTEDVAVWGQRRLNRFAVRVGYGGAEQRWATVAKVRSGFVVCAALRGTPGKRCSCSVYDVRPGVCREFEPGSARCLDARAELDL